MCHYKNAVAAYNMCRRFRKVSAYEAESYRQMMRGCIRKHIAATECLSDDDYLEIYFEVVKDAVGYDTPVAA
jgi:hypothetical protein